MARERGSVDGGALWSVSEQGSVYSSTHRLAASTCLASVRSRGSRLAWSPESHTHTHTHTHTHNETCMYSYAHGERTGLCTTYGSETCALGIGVFRKKNLPLKETRTNGSMDTLHDIHTARTETLNKFNAPSEA